MRQTPGPGVAYAARMTPMTLAQRAEVRARLDALAAEILDLACEVAALKPPAPASVVPLPRVAA